ncbi:MAG: Calx-beta domain-containing protein, partial [Chloroflexota bacterium]
METQVFPLISVYDLAVPEGNGQNATSLGVNNVYFTISLSKEPVQEVSVHYATADGTAKGGDGVPANNYDYFPTSGDVRFLPGDNTNKLILVTFWTDNVVEANETFTLVLSQPVGGMLLKSVVTATIQDDDAVPPPTVSLTQTPSSKDSDPTSATFLFIANVSPATFQCSLDGSSYVTCSSGITYTGLGTGSHTFNVKATD